MSTGLLFISCDPYTGGSGNNTIRTWCGGNCGRPTSECATSNYATGFEGCTRKGNASGTCRC